MVGAVHSSNVRTSDLKERRQEPERPQCWRSIVMQIRHILHGKGRDVVAIASTSTICDAAKLLTEKKIGALVVMDGNGTLTGIISERDLVQALAKGGAAALSEQVSEHMTPQPETCTEADTVECLMEAMTR